MSVEKSNSGYEKLVHFLAVTLACVVFPLIWVGGLVTTYNAGMAVPDWPTTYGWNMFAYPLRTWLFGPFDLFVEHGHRLLASLAGLISIALLVVAYRKERRRWFVAWCAVLLLAVIGQGVLGGVRVLFDDRVLAMIHGCVGPAFFAMVTATAVMSSRWWFEVGKQELVGGPKGRLSFACLGIVLLATTYGQIILGARLRHLTGWESHREFTAIVHAHLGTAGLLVIFSLVGLVATLVIAGEKRVKRPLRWLSAIVLIQLMLGVGTWIATYALPWAELNKTLAAYTIHANGLGESLITTAHAATGSLILAMSTLVTVRAWRLRRVADKNKLT